jgi:hypothetical protein
MMVRREGEEISGRRKRQEGEKGRGRERREEEGGKR